MVSETDGQRRLVTMQTACTNPRFRPGNPSAMSFASITFLVFFLIVLGLRLLIGRDSRTSIYLAALLVASLVFYAWHVPMYVAILLVNTAVDYVVARAMNGERNSRRRLLLTISIVVNLGLLCFFKYAAFLSGTLESLFALPMNATFFERIILPMGISFYTFQSMSYTIDVYRGRLQPLDSFWKFLLYVSFFPQLVAGPIVRATGFLYQFTRRRRPNVQVWTQGIYLIIRGFFLKLVVADNIAGWVDASWSQGAEHGYSSSAAFTLGLLFCFQIFADFAGYSSIARGLALMLGFRLPLNFDSPYLASTFSGFWKRWHISLSSWLRDYLYIPLGGNRGTAIRTGFNLMVVMVLGGLWHGAGFAFIVWGAIHGVALVIERVVGLHRRDRVPPWLVRIAWYGVVQLTVLVAFIFFRSETLEQGGSLVANLFAFRFEGFSGLAPALVFLIPPVAMHVRTLLRETGCCAGPGPREKAFWSAIMLALTLIWYATPATFIYFQF